jgi:hypothetical protein
MRTEPNRQIDELASRVIGAAIGESQRDSGSLAARERREHKARFRSHPLVSAFFVFFCGHAIAGFNLKDRVQRVVYGSQSNSIKLSAWPNGKKLGVWWPYASTGLAVIVLAGVYKLL